MTMAGRNLRTAVRGAAASTLLFGLATVQAAPPIPILACPYNIITPGVYVVTSDLTSAGGCIGIATDSNETFVAAFAHPTFGALHA
jgi:hypothetical protein